MRWAILAVAAVLAGGAGVPIGGEVAQSGAQSGIRTTLFTAWLPAGMAFGGVRGVVSLTGNNPTFFEALVMLRHHKRRYACVRKARQHKHER